MCTVTFIKQNEEIFITSNRDEAPHRDAASLVVSDFGTERLLFPMDPISGGSWIMMNQKQRVICLLNGGFTTFIPKPSYRLSRGVVVMDAAASDDLTTFFHSYNLADIAPFTLVTYDRGALHQFTWTGEERYLKEMNTEEPHIWSSATLYTPEVVKQREEKFKQWLSENPVRTAESIQAFHHLQEGDSKNGFIMNRDEVVKTLSITQILLQEEIAMIRYTALHTLVESSIQFKSWKEQEK